jgi:hypothetical protein
MSRQGEPRGDIYGPREVLKLREYAGRGFSVREAAKMIDRPRRGVEQIASRLKISFHGPMGAPKGNNNRRMGMLRQEMLRIAAGHD